jgi:hypothetical protein
MDLTERFLAAEKAAAAHVAAIETARQGVVSALARLEALVIPARLAKLNTIRARTAARMAGGILTGRSSAYAKIPAAGGNSNPAVVSDIAPGIARVRSGNANATSAKWRKRRLRPRPEFRARVCSVGLDAAIRRAKRKRKQRESHRKADEKRRALYAGPEKGAKLSPRKSRNCRHPRASSPSNSAWASPGMRCSSPPDCREHRPRWSISVLPRCRMPITARWCACLWRPAEIRSIFPSVRFFAPRKRAKAPKFPARVFPGPGRFL